MRKLMTIICLSIIMSTACSIQQPKMDESPEKGELFISAAASLTDALEELIMKFEAEHPHTKITLNFGGSGKLSQQIQHGAPVDIFLSADQASMDSLAEHNLLLPETRINFAKNELVLIAKEDTSLQIASLKDLPTTTIDQIAIGNPESVPAGGYAKEALEQSGIWNDLQDQFIYAKDVRQVLTYVESGNTEIGFIYSSDLMRSKSVRALVKIDEQLHDEIVYPAAVTASSDNPGLAKEFLEFLVSDTAQEILDKYGFSH